MAKTFIEITNRDIYDKLNCMEKKQNKLFKQQAVMVEHQAAINEKVKMHTKLIFALGGVLVTAIGWIFTKIL